jgi:hypothetical protein
MRSVDVLIPSLAPADCKKKGFLDDRSINRSADFRLILALSLPVITRDTERETGGGSKLRNILLLLGYITQSLSRVRTIHHPPHYTRHHHPFEKGMQQQQQQQRRRRRRRRLDGPEQRSKNNRRRGRRMLLPLPPAAATLLVLLALAPLVRACVCVGC